MSASTIHSEWDLVTSFRLLYDVDVWRVCQYFSSRKVVTFFTNRVFGIRIQMGWGQMHSLLDFGSALQPVPLHHLESGKWESLIKNKMQSSPETISFICHFVVSLWSSKQRIVRCLLSKCVNDTHHGAPVTLYEEDQMQFNLSSQLNRWIQKLSIKGLLQPAASQATPPFYFERHHKRWWPQDN